MVKTVDNAVTRFHIGLKELGLNMSGVNCGAAN